MTNTLSELFADRGVILSRANNAIVFVHGEALVGNRLRHGVVRLDGELLFVGRRRCRDLALVALPDAAHLLDGRRSRIQLLVRNGRRWGLRWRTSLRWVQLGVCRWERKQPLDAQCGCREGLQ